MKENTATDVARPRVPTLDQFRRRAAELLEHARQHQPGPRSRPADPGLPAAASRPLPHLPSEPPSPQKAAARAAAVPVLQPAALHGLAGLAVRTIAPHTEAHPASLLLQLLAVFGNLVDRGPHCQVDATRHGLNLFVVLVGDSGKARKGSSWNQISRLFAEVDPSWLSSSVTRAPLTLSSFTQTLCDRQPQAGSRLLALAPEFTSVLQTLNRGNGQLCSLLHAAWDDGLLSPPERRRRPQPIETHFSLIAHITQSELARHLPRSEAQNGFANRCLWACVQRSNCLPHGGNLSAAAVSEVAGEIRRALNWAKDCAAAGEILFERDSAASDLWQQHYSALSQLHSGMRCAATGRAEAQVLRLSAIYAALDSSATITLPHLQAALAVWDYCYESAAMLFGVTTGDPITDRICEAVAASERGLSKDQIRRLFHGHLDAARLDSALETLVSLGALSVQTEPTRGRPSTLWSTPTDADSAADSDFGYDDDAGFEEDLAVLEAFHTPSANSQITQERGLDPQPQAGGPASF